MTALPDMAMMSPPDAEAYGDVTAPADPWLQRRGLGWGASDMPLVLVALGRAPAEQLPSYLRPDVAVTNRTHGAPRCIAQKAGLIAPRKRGSAADAGTKREPELLRAWSRTPEAADVGAITHASTVPREWMPLIDRHCAALSCTPDGWARDALGSLVALECKCSVHPYRDLKWHHEVQVQAQLAVMGASWGLVIEGPGWAADFAGDGPPKTYGPIERDDAVIAELRSAAREAWAWVERLKAEVAG